MEMLPLYFIKSAGLMALFFLAYHFLLRTETFFSGNRWYLLSGLALSCVLPLVTFKKIIWIEPIGQSVDWTTLPSTLPTMMPIEEEKFEIDWLLVALAVYGIGFLIFLTRFLLDFYALHKMLKGKTIRQQEDYKLLDVSENVSPFSYFQYIVFNSSLYSPTELVNILEHEKVHSYQNHTVDVLISRFFCILFWCNPFVWLYKKAIMQNLEFIADNEASKKISDRKAYQHTLLKITTHDCCVAITNHFYQSLIKKRIVMLNKNQSKKWNSWKYAFIVPALVAFMFYFQVKVIAQEKQGSPITVITQKGIEVVVDKNSSDADLKSEAKRVKKEHGVNLKFSKVKRNKSGEIIAIKAEFKDQNGKKGVTQVSSDEPIKPIRFFKNGNSIGFGSPKSKFIHINGDQLAFNSDDDEDNDEEFSFDFDFDGPEAPEGPEPPEAPEAPEAPEEPGFPNKINGKRIVIKNGDHEGHAMVIVDGEVIIDTDQLSEDILHDMAPMLKDLENMDIEFSGFGNGEKAIIIDKKMQKEKMKEQKIKMKAEMQKFKDQFRGDKAKADFSKSEMEAMKAEMAKVKADMEKAKAEMEQAKAEFEKAKADLKKK